jgi:hypothetical protein
MPLQRDDLLAGRPGGSALQYGRSDVIASKVSASTKMRERADLFGAQARGYPLPHRTVRDGRAPNPRPDRKRCRGSCRADLRVAAHVDPLVVGQRSRLCKMLSDTPILPMSQQAAALHVDPFLGAGFTPR